MKRRIFLSATGTFGIVGAASGASVFSTIFSSLSTHVSLQEFSSDTKKVLEEFIANLAYNLQDHGIEEDHVTAMAMPTRIIKKECNGKNDQITYKNKLGNYVVLGVNAGVSFIRVTNEI